MSQFRTILITGGAGFVGSSLALALRRNSESTRVIAFDNLTRRGSELNLPRLRQAGVEFIHGDVRQPEDLQAIGKFDLLIDCAAEPSVQAGMTGSPRSVFDINLGGTINCLEAARCADAAFLFLSTSRVYPIQALNEIPWNESSTRFEWLNESSLPGASAAGISEDFPLNGVRSYYGASKLASELIAQEYAASAGMPLLINRCGVLTGPWQMGKVDQGVVALWVLRHHFGIPLKYIGYGGTGRQVRDVLHVEDLYRLICLQMNAPDAWDGRIYNVGGGRQISTSLVELTDICQQVAGNVVPVSPMPETSDVDLRIYLTDASRVQSEFNWKPQISIEEIVQQIHDWVRNNEDQLRQIAAPASSSTQIATTVEADADHSQSSTVHPVSGSPR